MKVVRLAQSLLVCADPAGLARFYADALGAEIGPTEPVADPSLRDLLGGFGCAVTRTSMSIGREEVVLLAYDPPGAPYPAGSTSTDLWFQHLAIVVSDIAAVHARVMDAGAAAISRHGPEQLPPSTGGVRAFKFRDPEGHPLELLQFPAGVGNQRWHVKAQKPVLGIDHSAISVGDTEASRAFYHHTLGFALGQATLNQGPTQVALDDVADVRVDVQPLLPVEPTPHVELLGYRTGLRRPALGRVGDKDVAATRLLFAIEGSEPPRAAMDPDGHRFLVVGASRMSDSIAKI